MVADYSRAHTQTDLQTPERSQQGPFGPERTVAEHSSQSCGRPGRDKDR